MTKAAIDPVWYLPGIAERFSVTEDKLRRTLFEQTGGMYPELVTRPDISVFLPPIGGITLYIFGDPAALADRKRTLACRVHDECNGSDVFGSDICTCRPYLIHGIAESIREAQKGGAGLIVYNRKEGRALGEVTKFLVYNARKRQPGGDQAATYFERTECVAGVQDARFQQLMPDVLHWLGITRIDRFVSMSNMKYDAITASGIDIVERVPIPDGLIPDDAKVEMEAKKAAGYFTPEGAPTEDELKATVGRNCGISSQLIASIPSCPRSGNPVFFIRWTGPAARTTDVLICLSCLRSRCARARARDAGGGGGGKLDAFHAPSRPLDETAALRRAGDPRELSIARRAAACALAAFQVAGDDLWREIAANATWPDAAAKARAAFDLAIVSVLLDAGAGPDWRYRDAASGIAGRRARKDLRSQALRMFEAGAFSERSGRSVARRCRRGSRLSPRTNLPRGFQVARKQSADRAGGPRGADRKAWRGSARSARGLCVEGSRAAGRAVRSSGVERGWQARCPRRKSCGACCIISARSGRDASRSMASRSATPGGIPRSDATTRPTA